MVIRKKMYLINKKHCNNLSPNMTLLEQYQNNKENKMDNEKNMETEESFSVLV